MFHFYFESRSYSSNSGYQQHSTFSNFFALHTEVQHNNTDCDCNRPENCPHVVTIEIKAIESRIGKRVEETDFLLFNRRRKFLRVIKREIKCQILFHLASKII